MTHVKAFVVGLVACVAVCIPGAIFGWLGVHLAGDPAGALLLFAPYLAAMVLGGVVYPVGQELLGLREYRGSGRIASEEEIRAIELEQENDESVAGDGA